MRFSSFLRRCRKQRRLSLRQVERLSEAFPERISNSYLAYCETGRLLPSLGKLMTLSKVLGIPLQSFTERLELDREAVAPVDLGPSPTWEQMRTAGIAEAEAGRLQSAYACFEKVAEMIESNGRVDVHAQACVQLDTAIVLKRMSRHYTARDLLERILSQKGLGTETKERALLQLGSVLREMDRLPIAVMVAREALVCAESRGDERRRAHAASLLANSLFDLGNHDEAAPLYHMAIKQFRHEGDEASLACSLANLGNCLVASGHFTEGIRKLRESEALAKQARFDRQRADIACYLGQAYKRMGQTARAESCFLASNQIARSGEYTDILFTSTWHLRELALRSGREKEASDHLRSLRYFRTRVDNTNEEIKAYDRMMNTDADDSGPRREEVS